MLTDIAIPGHRNVIKKEDEKILKYEKLTAEIQRMSILKAKVIPVITRATGTISESLRQHLSNKSGKHEIKEIQKKSHTWHCIHILREVLM